MGTGPLAPGCNLGHSFLSVLNWSRHPPLPIDQKQKEEHVWKLAQLRKSGESQNSLPLKSSIDDDRISGRCAAWRSLAICDPSWRSTAARKKSKEALWKLPHLMEIDNRWPSASSFDDFHEVLGKASAKNATALPQLHTAPAANTLRGIGTGKSDTTFL